MRIWDIHPGYLNRQSLLGEHRELHGIVSILTHGKKGYANHPETKRWIGCGWALKQRHMELACEMQLRGYTDRSPVHTRSNRGTWPATYIDKPHIQFLLLKEKYRDREEGRIPLPRNVQELWSQHKYSVLARDPKRYKEIGPRVAQQKVEMEDFAIEMVEMLRVPPSQGGIRNALQHMWGHVTTAHHEPGSAVEQWSLKRLLAQTQKYAQEMKEPYLSGSTALSELRVWL
jgi:uncharacterized protein YbgA (DUF1722 family)